MPSPIARSPKTSVALRYPAFTAHPFAERVGWSSQTVGRAKPGRPEVDTASGVSCRARRGRHHHAAGRVLEHEVDGAAEDAPATALQVTARRAHHDDLAVTPLRLVDDRATGATGAHQASDHVDPVRVADRACLVEQVVRTFQRRVVEW